MQALACAVALVAFYQTLYLAGGFDPIGAVRSAEDVYREGVASGRPYAFWLFGAPAAFLIAGGLPISWYALRALGARRGPAVALFTVLTVAAVVGFTKGETVVAASSMVVYGEGAYDCTEHGRIVPGPRALEQLRRREWEPHCPSCGRELTCAPCEELTPLRPTSVYGITKRDQEALVLTLGGSYGIEAVALRYLRVYGPRQALGNPYTGVAAIFAVRLLHRRRPIVFEDGRQLRDLVHVLDIVRATIAAMDAPRAAGHAINVATGRRLCIAELANGLARTLGSPLEPELTGEFRVGDIRHCVADTAAGRELLGFEASVERSDGLAELARWAERQHTAERGDEALADLRSRGLVG